MFRNLISLVYNHNFLKDKTTLRNYAKLHLQGVSLYLILLGYTFTRDFFEEMQAVIKSIYNLFLPPYKKPISGLPFVFVKHLQLLLQRLCFYSRSELYPPKELPK